MGMRYKKLEPRQWKAIAADIQRMEKKHGLVTFRVGMRRYLTQIKETEKRENAIVQLQSELDSLKARSRR